MTLLLLISALLSALTGGSDGVARAVAPQAVSRGVAVSDIAAPAVRISTARPANIPAPLPALAAAVALPAFHLAAIVPLFAERRRE